MNDIPTAITAALQNVARPAHPACLMILIRLSSMGSTMRGEESLTGKLTIQLNLNW